MKRIPVASQTLSTVGYDVVGALLEVEYKHGGVVQYHGVRAGVYWDLMRTGSLGAFDAYYAARVEQATYQRVVVVE
ncbi:MAG: KTSC domain-containing protein [Gemmatirosa sp.]